mgnify:CR=1 FL=1
MGKRMQVACTRNTSRPFLAAAQMIRGKHTGTSVSNPHNQRLARHCRSIQGLF